MPTLPPDPTGDKIQTEVRKAILDLLKNDNTLYDELFPVSGSNSNGDWIQFPNGTMICSGTASVTTNSVFAPFFTASTETLVTFPVPFIATPRIEATPVFNISIGSAFMSNKSGTHAPSKTSFGVNVMSSDNATTFIVHWIAIGKWK